ncbi:MAG: helix-turn-helix transcriptional regulator [Caldilineaceae bacterium]
MVVSPTKAKLAEVFANGLAANPGIKDLLERLEAFIGNDADDDPILDAQMLENSEVREVMFEVQLDGFCYTLTRTYPQSLEAPVNLSGREQEIARLVAKGLPNKTIAAILEISPWTVSTHLRRIFAKLGVNTRAEMVAYVLKEGLLAGNSSGQVA